MSKLRLLLLATTAMTAMQFASSASHAEGAPIVVAQAQREELGPDGKPKQPPREAPKQPPAKGAPTPPPPPPAVAPRPAPPPPPPAAAPHPAPPPPPPAATPHPAPPPPQRPTAPPPPPPAVRPVQPPPPPPPAAPRPPAPPTAQPAPQQHAPTPPAPPPPPTPPAGRPQGSPAPAPQPGQHERPVETPAPGHAVPPPASPAPGAGRPNAAPAAQPPAPPPPPPPAAGAPAIRPGTAPGATPPAPPPPQGAGAPPSRPGTAPGNQTAAPPASAPPVLVRRAPPQVTAPLPPPPPPPQNLTPLPANPAAIQGPRRLEDFRAERREVQEGGRTVITEPGRVIIRDPSGEAFVRHDEMERFRFGARDIQTQRVGNEMRTIVVRPDGSQVITVLAPDGSLLRRIRRDPRGQEFVIIDNSYRDPRAVGGFYVDLPPPVIRIPYDRYIVDASDAPPELIYDTMMAPPVDRIDRRYSLDEIRYSPNVRMLMPSIDVNTINFELGSWEIAPDQAAKLQAIADGLNRAIQRNPREVFLIEGHTDATGNDTDNLSLSDRRAESAAELLTQQFGVPAENLTSQGYGSQYLKEQTDGPSRVNRRVTIRRITPLLNGAAASLPPPPPGIAPPR
ncbi:OmpA family protein [Bradyrhizobium sp. Tv2a-2]|uniref:OmpA family protein n=1 Tax=Bradyrhizobium sp. Tv2a-2 TaxID=113395 RepID=UPI000A060848|nr:OmpA family protein [Bradyrhizobium sp. Tv2a-2]